MKSTKPEPISMAQLEPKPFEGQNG